MIVSSCRQLHQAHQPLTAVAESYRTAQFDPSGRHLASLVLWLAKVIGPCALVTTLPTIWMDDVRIYGQQMP